MMKLFESPTHVITHLRQAIEAGEFTETNAYLFAGIAMLVTGMQRHPSPQGVNHVAHEPETETSNRIKKLVVGANKHTMREFIDQFRENNTVFIINQLKLYERRLLALYQEFDVDLYA